jgi:hypothetical protein
LQREDFFDQANIGWYSDVLIQNAVKVITAKFKNLRRVLVSAFAPDVGFG